MRFGQQFNFHKIPEWSQHYLDYKILKKLIKKYMKRYKGFYNYKLDISLKEINKFKEKRYSVWMGKKKEILLEQDPINDMNQRNNSGDLSMMRNSLDFIDDNEAFDSFIEKFNEQLNLINIFFQSKYNEQMKDFECLKTKLSNLNKKEVDNQIK